jgi:GcrA cell cycle regulator
VTELLPAHPPIDTMGLRDYHCRWPYDASDGVIYCGAQPKAGSAYCVGHCQIAFQPMYQRKAR